jgi:hypothetical protein
LRHCAASRKVAGSITDEVIGFLIDLFLLDALWHWGRSQPLTEMSTGNYLGGKGWPTLKADSLTAVCEPIVYKIWEPRRLTTLWASTACYRDKFTFFPYAKKRKLG